MLGRLHSLPGPQAARGLWVGHLGGFTPGNMCYPCCTHVKELILNRPQEPQQNKTIYYGICDRLCIPKDFSGGCTEFQVESGERGLEHIEQVFFIDAFNRGLWYPDSVSRVH